MDAASDLALGRIRAALGSQCAARALEILRAIKNGSIGCRAACCVQMLPGGTGIPIVFGIKGEVASAERAVLALRLVPDGDMRLDLLLLHEPAK